MPEVEVRPNSYLNLIKFIFKAVLEYKFIFVSIVFGFAIFSVVYAISIPNTYRSTAILVPASDNGGSSLSSMMGQLGALSSLAGINIGSGGAKKDFQIKEMLRSRDFIIPFITRHDLKPLIFAANDWDQNSNTLSFDEEIYNEKNKQWVREVKAPKKPEPSDQEAYDKFRELFKITFDRKENLFKLSIDFVSPVEAQVWLTSIVKEFNDYSKTKHLDELNKNIQFLEERIEQAKVVELRASLYELLEEQLKTVMLSQSKENYALEIIQSPFVPEEKQGPKRAMICIGITFLGGLLAVFITLILFYRKESK